MTQRGYLRQPSLRGDAIVFVCDDDLWRVDAGGGTARRLTAGLGEPATPVLSPDGKWIAYVGRDEQHPEVYLMPAEGGPARRMTWLGPDVIVRGWTPDGHILFVTTHGQPFFRNYRAFTLGVDGGLPEMLPLGQVNHLAFGPGNAMVIGRNTADPARWKRYRGGTAGHLWIDATGSGTFRRMTKLAGNITSPMWIGKRVYFLSDAEGVGNLYSCRPDGSDQRRHTDHDDLLRAQRADRRHAHRLPVRRRHLAVRPGEQPHGARRHRRAVASHAGGAQVRRRGRSSRRRSTCIPRATASRSTRAASSSRWRCGRARSASTARPTASAIGTDNGWPTARRWSRSATSRARSASSSSSDGKSRDAAVGRRPRAGDARRAARARASRSPTIATKCCSATSRRRSSTVVDRSDAGRSEDLAWSPDGAWLAYSFWTEPAALRDQAARRREAATSTLVTQPEFRDYCAGVRSGGQVSLFPVGAHVRPGVRQRAVRAELSRAPRVPT